ncbi:MAG: S9 family peptidase [Hyphomonadaceae bacterium]|nr:S9 family peptidase [Hyphomonadaceae bacterium]
MRVLQLFAALGVLLAASCSTGRDFAMSASSDPYLWLEEVEGARALDWARAENQRSLAVLENDPRYQRLRESALAIAQNQDRLPTGQVRGAYYYNFWQDAAHVRGLWRRSPLEAYRRGQPAWEILLDVDALAARENANWVFEGAECAPSGLRCMIQLSDGGKDAATWREFDIQAKAFVAGGFAIPEAKTWLAFKDNDTLVLASPWDASSVTESGYGFVVKEWRRGTPLASAREILRGQPSDVGMFPGSYEDTDGTTFAIVSEAKTFFESVNWLLGAGAPQQLTLPRKATIRAIHQRQVIATLEEDWRFTDGRAFPSGALVAIPLAEAASPSPRVTILYAPGPRESIEQVAAAKDAILVAGYQNVRGRMLRIAYDGQAWSQSQMALPQNGVIAFAGADSTQSTAFAVFDSFLTPSTLYALDARTGAAAAIRALPAQFNADNMLVEQYEAESRDGTRIPYFVVRRKDAPLNGANPTLLYAYGGFQASQLPSYSGYIGKLWLERGGVYALANIRGGGEFGPAWHHAGLKTNRQVIYDDYAAVAEDLIARDITSPRRLGASGRSNGGLLMGVILNQHPELFNAAVVGSPLLDMLRYDQLLAGASWVGEYGSPSVPAERAWLEEMSPYQNLRARDKFPTPFIYTSTKDDRVHPGHARKYAARLEELGLPFLYYENIEGGHSAAANLQEIARRRALEFTYLSQRLID